MRKGRYWFALITSVLVATIPSFLVTVIIDVVWVRQLLIGLFLVLGGAIWVKLRN